jgi:sugar phosphate isomerase/epimerase
LPRHWLSYAQVCDAPAHGPAPDDADGILEEAIHGRLQTGEGGLDLTGMLDALPPALPLSVELRSRALYDAYPDGGDRAMATARATRRFLASRS